MPTNVRKKLISVIAAVLLAAALIPLGFLKIVWAGGIEVSTEQVKCYIGQGMTVDITAYNATATFKVWSENENVASVSGGGWVENETVGFSIYACGAGTTNVNIECLVADEDTLTEDTKYFSIEVIVSEPPVGEPEGEGGWYDPHAAHEYTENADSKEINMMTAVPEEAVEIEPEAANEAENVQTQEAAGAVQIETAETTRQSGQDIKQQPETSKDARQSTKNENTGNTLLIIIISVVGAAAVAAAVYFLVIKRYLRIKKKRRKKKLKK